jgi:type II secretory pathway pseudopilin PulG
MKRIKMVGFTLIEILLVLTIITAIVMTGMHYYQQKIIQDRIDKTIVDMQQILTAAMTFYVAKGVWPQGASSEIILNCLTGNGAQNGTTTAVCDLPLLPRVPQSLWFATNLGTGAVALQDYSVATVANDPKFYVYVQLPLAQYRNGLNTIYAGMIANKMPSGYTSSDTAIPPQFSETNFPCNDTSVTCSAVAAILPPGQTLFNAGSVNYAGAYKHGGCIPAPTCPSDPGGAQLIPQVFVVPISMSGLFGNVPATGNQNMLPITSFTAYVQPQAPIGSPSASPVHAPAACNPGTTPPVCASQGDPVGTLYWRACVDVKTQQGSASATAGSHWGNYMYVAAFTRCELPHEPTGGGINLYEQ